MVRQGILLFRHLGAWLAVLAIVLQGLTPAGIMVARTAAGPQWVICTGHGPAPAINPAGQPARPNGKADSQGACAFAGHGPGVAGPLQAPTFAKPVTYAVISSAPRTAGSRIFAAIPAPPPPPRGPPSLSL
jgi:hypothetical protein